MQTRTFPDPPMPGHLAVTMHQGDDHACSICHPWRGNHLPPLPGDIVLIVRGDGQQGVGQFRGLDPLDGHQLWYDAMATDFPLDVLWWAPIPTPLERPPAAIDAVVVHMHPGPDGTPEVAEGLVRNCPTCNPVSTGSLG